MSTRERLARAIGALGKTEAERAKKIGFTVRTIDNWIAGKGLRQIECLEAAGVIHIADESCSCRPSARPDQATSDTA